MRTTTILCGVAVVLTAACAGTGETNGQGTPARCANTPHLTLILNHPNGPRAVPENRCTLTGETFPVRIVPRGKPAGTVLMVAKISNADGGGLVNWLSGINSADADEFEIVVPDASYFEPYCSPQDMNEQRCYFEYTFYAPGEEPVDPRVTVLR